MDVKTLQSNTCFILLTYYSLYFGIILHRNLDLTVIEIAIRNLQTHIIVLHETLVTFTSSMSKLTVTFICFSFPAHYSLASSCYSTCTGIQPWTKLAVSIA